MVTPYGRDAVDVAMNVNFDGFHKLVSTIICQV